MAHLLWCWNQIPATKQANQWQVLGKHATKTKHSMNFSETEAPASIRPPFRHQTKQRNTGFNLTKAWPYIIFPPNPFLKHTVPSPWYASSLHQLTSLLNIFHSEDSDNNVAKPQEPKLCIVEVKSAFKRSYVSNEN